MEINTACPMFAAGFGDCAAKLRSAARKLESNSTRGMVDGV